MSDVVIRAESLGKKYLIGHQANRERYTALRDVLARTAKDFARSALDMVRGRQLISGDQVEDFWALKDVSFDIRRGEVVGIIGRNGAGKSTLLKILSRITEPSQGRIQIKGRVASLLEVGTGFHPELTGRENIYLNGAILGMSRVEIRRKFDEIVAFAEVEKFLDTPVKRYSSGMYVRLAFAVAAHLEPEILIVDEVLAVGDAEFQKKCLGKMRDVAGYGRTVLFVSHNTSALRRLCTSGIVLKNGLIQYSGQISEAIHKYTFANESNIKKLENEYLCISVHFTVANENNLKFLVHLEIKQPLKVDHFHLFFQTSTGMRASLVDLMPALGQRIRELSAGGYIIGFDGSILLKNLASDTYTVGIFLSEKRFHIVDWDLYSLLLTSADRSYPIEHQGPALLHTTMEVSINAKENT